MLIRIAAFLLAFASLAQAGPKVTLVLGSDAPALEKDAAGELAGQLKRLYQAEVTTAAAVPNDFEHLILVGSPVTNPAIAALGEAWPKLTDQGHAVKSVAIGGKTALAIGGGSPAATFWAVAEHGYRLGIRTFTFGDLDPISPPAFHLDGWNVVMEPRLKVRGYTTLTPGVAGLAAWGLEDQQKLLRQLAKLKFNHVTVNIEPWYPCLDFEFEDKPRSSGYLHAPDKFLRIDGDAVGRSAMQGDVFFENSDLRDKPRWNDRLAAGTRLVQGIVDTAKRLGIRAAICLNPVHAPLEFKDALPGGEAVEPLGSTNEGGYTAPGLDVDSANPKWRSLSKAQLEAALKHFPTADGWEIKIPDRDSWYGSAKAATEAYQRLAARNKVEPNKRSLDLLIRFGGIHRVLYLDCISESLSSIRDVSTIPGVAIRTVARKSPSILNEILPPGTAFVSEVVEGSKPRFLFESHPAPKRESVLAVHVSEPDSILPWNCQAALKVKVDQLDHYQWSGFNLVLHNPSDSDPELHLASRLSFDSAVTARGALADLVLPVCGEGVSISVEKAFEALERSSSKDPAEFLKATDEMYRANTRSREGGRQFTLYFARRFEFAAAYVAAEQALQKVSDKNDRDTNLGHLEAAIDNFTAAGTSVAAIARNPSDRAIIATLNSPIGGYRQAQKKLEELEAAK